MWNGEMVPPQEEGVPEMGNMMEVRDLPVWKQGTEVGKPEADQPLQHQAA